MSEQAKFPAQEIYEAGKRGEITPAEMNAHMGMHIARTLHDHPARKYPEPNGVLTSYVEMRINGHEKRSPFQAVKNGEWIQIIIRIRTNNFADWDLLLWAYENCVRVGAIAAANKVMDQIEKHKSNSYPKAYFERALEVQRMDSEERRFDN